DRPLWIVRRQSNSIGIGQRRYATCFAKAAAMGNIQLTNSASAASEYVAKSRQMRKSLSHRDWSAYGGIDGDQTIDAFGPTWFLEKIKAVRLERFCKLDP